MKITFLEAKKGIGALSKSYGFPEGDRSYPNAATFKSHEFSIEKPDAEGVKEYRELLVKQASLGRALHTGQFTKPLKWERRKGRVDKDAKTQLLIIDIDGLRSDTFVAGEMSKLDVKRAAEEVVKMLPAELQNISYVAAGSSSFGQKDKSISVHIHMLLSSPVAYTLVKNWLKTVNFTLPEIYKKLDFTESLLSIKYIVDPALGEPSRIVYIAPPKFGDARTNPFEKDEERIVLVEKQIPCLDMHMVTQSLAAQSSVVTKLKNDKLKELRKVYGLAARKPKISKVSVHGQDTWVETEPPVGVMEFAYEDDDYIRYNRGGSTSCAYWVWRDNPEIVFNFHAEEPAFLFSVADPETYAWHISKFGGQYEKVKNETGKEIRAERYLLHDEISDTYNTLVYNQTEDKIIELRQRKSVTEAINSTRAHGLAVPDPIPVCDISFNPTEERVMFKKDGTLHINSFEAPHYLSTTLEPVWGTEVGYGSAFVISTECPVICELIIHLLGNDMECFEHFINWLAHIVQTRKPTNTAWLVHGEQGTGKGVFNKLIAKMLFGKYAAQRTLNQMTDDMFNKWMGETVFLMVDEFNMHATSTGVLKAAMQLKTWITEPVLTLRAMRKDQEEIPNWLNMLFATNDINGFAFPDKRRVNIAPRQTAMLDAERLPFMTEHEVATDKKIEEEMEQFASFLVNFKVDLKHVRGILMNEARKITLAAGMNSVEEFFSDIKTGNFSAFADYLDKKEEGLTEKEFIQLKNIKGILRGILDHVNTGKPCAMHRDDVRALYSFRAAKDISENFFGRMLNQNDLTIVKRSKPCGFKKPLSVRARCIETVWIYSDTDSLANLRANNRVFANVTPIESAEQNEVHDVVVKPSNSATW